MKRICKNCGKEFELTDGEISFYKSKNLHLPKRCKECRKHQNEGKGQNYNRVPPRQNPKKKISYMIAAILILAVVAVFRLGEGAGKDENQIVESDVSESQIVESDISENQIVESDISESQELRFRNEHYMNEHFEKHGAEFPYDTVEEYVAGANEVINSEESLHKNEKEDGDDVFFLEKTGGFVIVSTDGYIRTYFKPDDGIDYYNRQ